MGQGRGTIYNVLSLIFVLLTIGWLLFVITRMIAPPPAAAQVVVDVPTAITLPTITPTFTPSATTPPTDTPPPTETFTPTNTFEPSVTPTDAPTATPTEPPTATPSETFLPGTPTVEGPAFNPGILPPSFTPVTPTTPTTTPLPATPIDVTPVQLPTNTLFPSITPSGTVAPAIPNTALPPSPTRIESGSTTSPFPFTLREPITLTSNFANGAGCLWQGIGGQVFDTSNDPLTGVSVHVFGPGVDTFVVAGSNTLYGLSGFEVRVGNTTSLATFIVELQTSAGTVISDQVQVSFPATCQQNLALVNFRQTRPF